MSNERSQYNGQNGNGYQPLHGAPTPPPGPEVDAPTLADVQPGGRVRLGDQAERARFEAWVKNHVSSLARAADGEYASNFTHALWSAWQAALSAQPSPGGQDALSAMLPDDARLVGVIAENIERGKLDHPGFHRNTQLAEVLRRVLSAALAARQPVGEPFGWWLADENGIGYIARNPGQGVIDVYKARPGCSAMPLYAAPPAQQPAQVYLDGMDRALGEAIDQRDRYHEVADELADHIATITGADIGEHSSANCPWQNAIEAAEAYRPAQAVDLAPRPMDTAPTDGTLVRLLVDFTSNATEDTAGPAWTIGSNNDSNVMADERVGWQFAGWCWDHDHFTEGEGTPVGWLPLVGAPAQAMDLGPSIPSELAPVAAALKRFNECAEDCDSDGCDIGRDWFDALTTMGLLKRTQRSPAVWTMTAEGERLLALIGSHSGVSRD
ncbi:TPA: hypothetical protein ACOFDN_001111 [Stenotrophomonas maltophilia]